VAGNAVKSEPLIVLNNTTTQGLASRAAERFEAGGWTVSHFDNYQNDIASTCAYYDPSDPSAEAAAQALQEQFPAIKRIKPKFAELPAGPVVVVLTPDYTDD
jgi:LytR cell envelope-related transcriptional attenuator